MEALVCQVAPSQAALFLLCGAWEVQSSQDVVGSTAGPGLGDCTGEALSLAGLLGGSAPFELRGEVLRTGIILCWVILGICLLLVGFL